jgi:REP element-mobilizing transposase RayT
MRRNLKRYYGAGDLHFITCSCYRRQALLGTARQRDLLLTVLEQVRKRYQFVVAGYVVMPEHIHLLISEPQKKNPSTVMQALKLSFARRVLAQARRRRNPASSTTRRNTSGKSDSITPTRISTSGQNANALRNCATCTAIR